MSLPVTVFTPTYNRASALERVYASLVRQTPGLFEWLVVDDGSTDHTQELLARLGASAPFPVRVLRQPNSGKHVAHNRAASVAAGELTVILDSDDELLDGALDTLWSAWLEIPPAIRPSFAGVLGHAIDASGQLIGRLYDQDVMDGHWLRLAARGKIAGDKLPCYRTDLLRRFPFPESGVRASIPEGTVWCRIGTEHKLRLINKFVLRVHHDQSDSLMAQIRDPATAAYGRRVYASVVLDETCRELPHSAGYLVRHAVIVTRSSLHLGIGLREQYRGISDPIAKILWVLSLPLGFALWWRDKSNARQPRS